MGLFDRLVKTKRTPLDDLLNEIAAAYPGGPRRTGRPNPGTRAVADEIRVYDAGDHWFFLFLGLGKAGFGFDLSCRVLKGAGTDEVPGWPVEPVTRIMGGLTDGSTECDFGAVWKLGPVGPFAAVVALRDLQWPAREAPLHRLVQLVFITEAELQLQGDARRALFERLYEDRARLLNSVS